MAEEAEDRWRAAVAQVLKGAAVDTLTSRTRDGIAVAPLYAKAETAGPGLWRDTARPVRVIQRIDHPDPVSANAQARDDIAGGAGGLTLVWAGAANAGGFGLPIRDGDDLDRVLEGIDLTGATLRFDMPAVGGEAAAEVVRRWIERRGVAPDTLDLGLDPLDRGTELFLSPRGEGAARSAGGGVGAAGRKPSGAARRLSLAGEGWSVALLRADGRPHHAAGASEAQELAAVLSAGVAALRALEPLGLEAARDAVSVTLVADTDLLLTMAKLRALRRLWAAVEVACGLPPRSVRLHVEGAWRTLARRDAETNLLRQAVAATGAVLGGADSIGVLPFTAALGLPDGTARRLARNTTLILIEEAGLGRIADPAAGSGAIEALTGALCETAWRLFQDLERDGGLAAALRAGTWPAKLAAMRAGRHADLVAGRTVMVGVTAFAASGGALPTVLMPAPDVTPPSDAAREAAPFEAAS